MRSPEVAKECAAVGIEADIEHLLSLEQEYVYHGPLPRAGDLLHVSERLHDIRVKQTRNGPMVMVRFVVSFADENKKVRAECFYTSAYVRGESS